MRRSFDLKFANGALSEPQHTQVGDSTAMAANKNNPALEQLLRAIIDNDRPVVRRLLMQNPCLATSQVNTARLYSRGIIHWLYVHDTPLHLAAAGHRTELVAMLIDAGADVNSACNSRLATPLHYAAEGVIHDASYVSASQIRTIQQLLHGGAEIQLADKNGATALHRAVRSRCAPAVELLLDAGADLQARNASGATPFHLAVRNTGRSGSGHPLAHAAQRQIIRALIAHGAKIELKDFAGKSVRDWAGSLWIKELLKIKSR